MNDNESKSIGGNDIIFYCSFVDQVKRVKKLNIDNAIAS